MKRIFLFFICFVFMITLVSCKKKQDNKAYVSPAESQETIMDLPKPDTDKIDYDILGDSSVVKEQQSDTHTENGEKPDQYENITMQQQNASDATVFEEATTTDTKAEYTDEDFIITNFDFEGLPIDEVILTERDFAESYDSIDLQDVIDHIYKYEGIIVRGIKKENSTQYLIKGQENWYSETPIEIIDVYHGDVNIGDTVLMYERAAVWQFENNDKVVIIEEGNPPIPKNTEYILFLAPTVTYSRNGRAVYIPYEYSEGENSKGRNRITDEIKNAKSADEAGLTGFEKEVFDTYYYK